MVFFGKSNDKAGKGRTPTEQSHMLKDIDTARPAEDYRAQCSPDPDSDYTHLAGIGVHGDGLWVCCCSHENQLTHYTGAFPFKYMRCGKCNHILCEFGGCQTSEILTLQRGAPNPLDVAKQEQEVRWCKVCPSCGLSHRAEKSGRMVWFPEVCHCGQSLALDKLQFSIGSVCPYRRNPAKAAHDLCERRRDVNMKMFYEKQHAEEQLKRQREQQRLNEQRDQTPVSRIRTDSVHTAQPSLDTHQPLPSPPLPSPSPSPPLFSPLPRIAPLPPTLPRVRRLPPLTLDEQTCLLQRSGAQRRKTPGLKRFATFDDRDTPAPARPQPLTRAETSLNPKGQPQVSRNADERLKLALIKELAKEEHARIMQGAQRKVEVVERARAEIHGDEARISFAGRSGSTSPQSPSYREAFNNLALVVRTDTREYIADEFAQYNTR